MISLNNYYPFKVEEVIEGINIEFKFREKVKIRIYQYFADNFTQCLMQEYL